MPVKLPSESFSTLEQSPHVILHIDADGFFATCEQAVHPELRGKPVVTGLERGIVSAASYEAKAFGIKRGVALWEVKTLCPDAIILPSDYELYSLMSKRMFDILRRFTPHVEEYSIDEAFVDITGYHIHYGGSYEALARAIQKAVESELNISISIGVAQTKVLAKVAANWDKPHGLTLIHPKHVEDFLRNWQVEKLWGIGKRIGRRLRARGIGTALQLYQAHEGFIRQYLFKPQQEMWYELHGMSIYEVAQEIKESYDSISKTRTFTPPSSDPQYIFAQLSKNIENACIKARRYALVTQHIGIYIKRQDFSYEWKEHSLSTASAYPIDMMDIVKEMFEELYEPGVLYRATGAFLFQLQPDNPHQLALFEAPEKHTNLTHLYKSVDSLADRYGKHTVFLGSSLEAMTMLDERMEHRRRGATLQSRGNVLRDGNTQQHSKSKETKRDVTFSRRFVNIPLLGEAR